MKTVIIGARGVFNNYVDFEQFAEYLSVGLLNKGHQVVVCNFHNYSYKQVIKNKCFYDKSFYGKTKLGFLLIVAATSNPPALPPIIHKLLLEV